MSNILFSPTIPIQTFLSQHQHIHHVIANQNAFSSTTSQSTANVIISNNFQSSPANLTLSPSVEQQMMENEILPSNQHNIFSPNFTRSIVWIQRTAMLILNIQMYNNSLPPPAKTNGVSSKKIANKISFLSLRHF
jgi:hypothetical protein